MSRKTIFLVGADTGGHVVPVFALAKDLSKRSNIRIVLLGVGSEIEKKFFPQVKNAIYLKILAGKLNHGQVFQNIISALKSFAGFFQSVGRIIRYRPSVIFLKGNYATIPMAYAARILFVPIIIHESDAILGKSNRIISAFAKEVFLSYPTEIYKEKIKNARYSGLIMRENFQQDGTKDYRLFDFDPKRKTVLVIGGSLGAHSINQAIFGSLKELSGSFQIIHQTGSADIAEAEKQKTNFGDLSKNYYPVAFLDDKLFQALAISDLVVSRAGSMVMELAASRKAVILIPYPYAAADHQSANAKYFQDRKAAVILDGKELIPTVLYSTIAKLLTSQKKHQELAKNLFSSVKMDGREIVLKKLLEYLGS